MADNTQLNANTTDGDILATAALAFGGDNVKFEIVGVTILSGSEGSWSQTIIVGGAGAVGAGVQRITLASDDPAVALLTTIDADTGAIKTAVELLDNAVSGAGYNITQFAGAAVPIGAGVEATALRVTVATDSTGTLTVDTTGTSGLEVVQATAADLNCTEASAVAIKTAVEIIDDWDESDRAKVNPIVGQAGIAAGAGAVGVTVARTTLASDDPLVAKTPALGTAVMAASAPSTIATDDTQFGAIGAVADMDGSLHAQLSYLNDNVNDTHVLVDQLAAVASWAASTDASGITQESDNVPAHTGTTSLSIDKTGTATTEASYGKALAATVNGSVLAGDAVVTYYVRHASWTNIATVFVRLGTDASNYMEYAIDPADFSTSLWTSIAIPLHEGIQTGSGLNLAAVDYAAFGITTTASGNTPADVFFNTLELHSISGIELTVSSDVSASVVRVSKLGSNANSNVTTGAGTVSSGTQRVTIANDDTNLVLIKNQTLAALETAYRDDAQWDDDISLHTLVGGLYQSSPQTIIDGRVGPLQVDVNGNMIVSSPSVVVLGTATYTEATTKGGVMGAVRNDDLATLGDTDNEIVPLQVDANGAVYVNQAAAEPKQASGVAAGGAPGTDDMIAAVGGKKLLVTGLTLLATSTTTNNVFVDNVDNDLLGNIGNPIALSIDADGDTIPGIVLAYNPAGHFKTDTVNEAVTLNTSAAQDIIWSITWIETD